MVNNNDGRPLYKPSKKKSQDDKKSLELRKRCQRIDGKLKLESSGEVLPVRIVLNDLNSFTVGVFTTAQLPREENVALVIEYPKTMYLRATVAACNLSAVDTKVIATEQFRYRATLKFHCETGEEAKALEEFCQQMLAA
jgi:hypothetical protein